jgi:hypothetical protein
LQWTHHLDDSPSLCDEQNVSQITKRPAAEIVVDSNLARALLRTQHPDLSEFPLEEVAQGWDNFILRLGATMAVRFPRRLASVAALEHEQRWLSTVGGQPAHASIGKLTLQRIVEGPH